MSASMGGLRILVAGYPRCGKTTLATRLGMMLGVPDENVRHTDDLICTHDWSAASEEAARWMQAEEPFIIEGVSLPRALRKWLASHKTGKPADWIAWMDRPYETLTPQQETMAKGCLTVWREVLPELYRRGVQIDRGFRQ